MKEDKRKVLITARLSVFILLILVLTGIMISTLITFNKKTQEKCVAEVSEQIVAQVERQNELKNKLESLKEKENNIDEDLNSNNKVYERTSAISSRSSSRRRDTIAVVKNTEEEIVEHQSEKIIEVTTPIDEVTISVNMDLTVRTGLSREDFIKLIENTKQDTSGFFRENAGLIYDVCEKYQINEIFFCGLISAESGWNIAQNHRNTHNYISLMSGNGLIRFSSVENGIESAARILHERYLTPGGACFNGVTLSGVKTRFCPVSPTWVGLVYGRMQDILY